MNHFQRAIIFIDQDTDFLAKAKGFAKKLEHRIIAIDDINLLIPILDKEGPQIDVIAVNIDPFPMDQLKKIKTRCAMPDLKHIKILSISSPFSKFSPSTIGKIKQLCPVEIIDKSHDAEKTLFRITTIIFSDSTKRKNKRAIVFIPVKCSYDGKNFEAVSYSLSREGIFLRTEESIGTNGEITIEFCLPDDPSPIKIRCRVLYVLTDGTIPYRACPRGIGLRFIEAPDKVMDKIDKYVRDNL